MFFKEKKSEEKELQAPEGKVVEVNLDVLRSKIKYNAKKSASVAKKQTGKAAKAVTNKATGLGKKGIRSLANRVLKLTEDKEK